MLKQFMSPTDDDSAPPKHPCMILAPQYVVGAAAISNTVSRLAFFGMVIGDGIKRNDKSYDKGAHYRDAIVDPHIVPENSTINILIYRDAIMDHTIVSGQCLRRDSGAHYRDAIVDHHIVPDTIR